MGYDYDAAVIGGGAAGSTAARVAANLGAKVVLVEAHRLGGESTWTGCVPSKTLIRAGDFVNAARSGGSHGIGSVEPEVEFDRVIANVHRVREQVHHEAFAPESFDAAGIDIVRGRGRFVDRHTIEVTPTGPKGEPNGQPTHQITARYFIIASGSAPVLPPIEGLAGASVQTSASIFEIRDLPQSLAIIGAGRVGCELGQAFQRLGSQVTVLEAGAGILRQDDEELASMLQEHLEDEGIRFLLGASVTKVVSTGPGSILEIEQGGAVRNVSADLILVTAGKRPNIARMGLDSAGIQYTPTGIVTDDRGRTNVKHIFAVGGATGLVVHTHMVEHAARVAAMNALMKTPPRPESVPPTWVTFTDPELAHVGVSEEELKSRGVNYQLYRFGQEKVHRAAADGRTKGMIKILADRQTGKILGANILGHAAGDQIGYFVLAMKTGLTLKQLSETVFPYPTYATGIRDASSHWEASQAGEGLSRFMQKAFGLRGDTP